MRALTLYFPLDITPASNPLMSGGRLAARRRATQAATAVDTLDQ